MTKTPTSTTAARKTLRDALTGPHEPDAVTGLGDADGDAERDDLIAYVKSL